MIFRRILQLLSFGILLYLLVDAFMHIEYAASKNNALTSWQKAEIENIRSVDSLKDIAKKKLDVIRSIHRGYAKRSLTTFWLLVGVTIIQVILLFSTKRKCKD